MKPRVAAADFDAWRSGIREQRQVMDAFQNLPANLGYQSSNLLESTAYPLTRLSFNYILLQSLYRSNWIIRKIVDLPAEDMTKNWVSLTSQVPPKELSRFDQCVTATGTVNQCLSALKWARLFGGAAAIIIIKGDERKLDRPLDLDDVLPDTYRGLIPLDRWSGISPSADLCTDINRPLDFGLPEHYQVTLKVGGTFRIHASRVIRFIGRDIPSWEKEVEQGWGISEVEVLYDELRKRDNTSMNISSLVFRANIMGLRQNSLNQMLSGLGASAQAQKNFYTTIAAQAALMSNQGLMVLPEDGGLETHPYAFGGLGPVYEQIKEDISGAAEMPYSRLFGRPPGGLATTNEGDEHVYYERIKAKQKRELDPQVAKLFPVIAMSLWGEVPADFAWNWKPVATLSSTEQATQGQARTSAVLAAFDSGVVSQKTVLQEFKQQSSETELWTNVTDDMIAKADDTVLSPVEAMTMQAELEGAGEEGGEGDKDKKDKGKPATAKGKGKGKSTTDAAPSPALEAIGWRFHGMTINIENLRGSVRTGNGPDGPWFIKLTVPYGYIQGTEGVDGDPVDCFVGAVLDAPYAYVIHTKDVSTGQYDEDKVMLGFESVRAARDAFIENYTGGSAHLDSMNKVAIDDLPDMLKSLRGRKLVAQYA